MIIIKIIKAIEAIMIAIKIMIAIIKAINIIKCKVDRNYQKIINIKSKFQNLAQEK